MTDPEKELRIMFLEDALEQAQHTITFLHECLTEPETHSYAYPHQTQNTLKKFKELYEPLPGCWHSVRRPDTCDNCNKRINRYIKMADLQLKINNK